MRQRPGFTLVETLVALAITGLTLAVCGKALDIAIQYKDRSAGEFSRARKVFRLRRVLTREMNHVVVTGEDSVFRVQTRQRDNARTDSVVFTRTGTLLPFRRDDTEVARDRYQLRRVCYRCIRGPNGLQLIRLEQKVGQESALKVPVLEGVQDFALETGIWGVHTGFADRREAPDYLRVRLTLDDGTSFRFTCYPLAKHRFASGKKDGEKNTTENVQ